MGMSADEGDETGATGDRPGPVPRKLGSLSGTAKVQSLCGARPLASGTGERMPDGHGSNRRAEQGLPCESILRMKGARFGVAVFVLGMAVALGVFAYLLDHARAGAQRRAPRRKV
jgi:hypothetical protein